MESRASYTLNKFSQAVWVLATGPGDVRSRLHEAYISLAGASASDLPDDLRADFKWVTDQLGRYEPTDVQRRRGWGSLDATLTKIKNKTGVKIAERIVAIELELRRRLEHR